MYILPQKKIRTYTNEYKKEKINAKVEVLEEKKRKA
jgi:hypothetical protein